MDHDRRPDGADRVDAVPGDGRAETQTERLDRNWAEILQELRVTQTGTQILTGFLLALAFQPRFAELDAFQVSVYLALVSLATLATIFALAPVSLHRSLFRERAKAEIVHFADVVLRITLIAVALLLTGTALLIFDVVAGRIAGVIASALALVIIVALWRGLPVLARARRRE